MRRRRQPIDPKLIHAELESIRLRNNGKLRPTDVVDTATPEESVLHPFFEWDDSVAAREHRLWQARQLIKEVTVIVDDRPAMFYYSVPQSRRAENYYAPAEIIIESPSEFAAALELLLRKFEAAKRALDALRAVAASAEDPEKMERIAVALAAFAAASEAVRRIQ